MYLMVNGIADNSFVSSGCCRNAVDWILLYVAENLSESCFLVLFDVPMN